MCAAQCPSHGRAWLGMLPPPSVQHAQLDVACCHRIGAVRLKRAHRCWGHQVRGLRSTQRGRWQPRHGVTAEATLKRSALRASRPNAPALAGEPAACTSNSTSTTPSACHAHSARAAQLVHMLTVLRNPWQGAARAAGPLPLRGWWSSSPFSNVRRCGKAPTHVHRERCQRVCMRSDRSTVLVRVHDGLIP